MLEMGSENSKSESSFSKEEAVIIPEKDKNVMQDGLRILSADSLCQNSSRDDLPLEIVDVLPEEDVRLNNEGQETTECSSSFGHTQSEDEGQSCEVESELRGGNGAMPLAEDLPPIRRKKRALNVEWKAYRQGIEWRCRWLALRVKELQAESSKYNRILALRKEQKEQYLDQQQDGSAVRSTIIGYTHKNRILRRRRRRKAEEDVDLKCYMSKHPVFSRYEKRKLRNQDASGEEANKDEEQKILEVDDFSANFEDDFVDNFTIEEDSVEQYLWHVEAMQIRVSKLKEYLIRGYRNATKIQPVAISGGNGKSTPVPTPKAHHGGTSTVRRRNSDFDINNVIMPDNLMANYVEPARHEFIETPHWRTPGTHTTSDGGSSSEDTDDEAYNRRHAMMLIKEREDHYAPVLNKNKIISGKGNWKSTTPGKERPTGPPPALDVIEDFPDFPSTFVFIPKRKRRKRESRDIVKTTEAVLTSSNGEPLEEQAEMDKD